MHKNSQKIHKKYKIPDKIKKVLQNSDNTQKFCEMNKIQINTDITIKINEYDSI